MSTSTIFDLFEPDVLLPSQWLFQRRKLTGEARLMLALVEDCFSRLGRCVRLTTNEASLAQGRLRRELEDEVRWLMGAPPTAAVEFAACCEVLGLDASAVQKVVKEKWCVGKIPARMYLHSDASYRCGQYMPSGGLARSMRHRRINA